jgi:hypothetical protein
MVIESKTVSHRDFQLQSGISLPTSQTVLGPNQPAPIPMPVDERTMMKKIEDWFNQLGKEGWVYSISHNISNASDIVSVFYRDTQLETKCEYKVVSATDFFEHIIGRERQKVENPGLYIPFGSIYTTDNLDQEIWLWAQQGWKHCGFLFDHGIVYYILVRQVLPEALSQDEEAVFEESLLKEEEEPEPEEDDVPKPKRGRRKRRY